MSVSSTRMSFFVVAVALLASATQALDVVVAVNTTAVVAPKVNGTLVGEERCRYIDHSILGDDYEVFKGLRQLIFTDQGLDANDTSVKANLVELCGQMFINPDALLRKFLVELNGGNLTAPMYYGITDSVSVRGAILLTIVKSASLVKILQLLNVKTGYIPPAIEFKTEFNETLNENVTTIVDSKIDVLATEEWKNFTKADLNVTKADFLDATLNIVFLPAKANDTNATEVKLQESAILLDIVPVHEKKAEIIAVVEEKKPDLVVVAEEKKVAEPAAAVVVDVAPVAAVPAPEAQKAEVAVAAVAVAAADDKKAEIIEIKQAAPAEAQKVDDAAMKAAVALEKELAKVEDKPAGILNVGDAKRRLIEISRNYGQPGLAANIIVAQPETQVPVEIVQAAPARIFQEPAVEVYRSAPAQIIQQGAPVQYIQQAPAKPAGNPNYVQIVHSGFKPQINGLAGERVEDLPQDPNGVVIVKQPPVMFTPATVEKASLFQSANGQAVPQIPASQAPVAPAEIIVGPISEPAPLLNNQFPARPFGQANNDFLLSQSGLPLYRGHGRKFAVGTSRFDENAKSA